MNTSKSINQIVPALLSAQKVIGSAKKGASNPFFKSKYADLGSVMEACKEALNENGITILQPVSGWMLETILLHESGEWMSSETPVVCASVTDPQKMGSAITYARRYGLQSMVFIPAEDDDGNFSATPPKTGGGLTSSTGYAQTVTPTLPTTLSDVDVEEALIPTKCEHCGATGKYHRPDCPNRK